MDTTWTRTQRPAPAAPVKGDVVSYSDIANLPTFHVVIGIVRDAWGTEAELVDLASGRIHTASLRGAGWVMAERTA